LTFFFNHLHRRKRITGLDSAFQALRAIPMCYLIMMLTMIVQQDTGYRIGSGDIYAFNS
jgi:hypothetical protein